MRSHKSFLIPFAAVLLILIAAATVESNSGVKEPAASAEKPNASDVANSIAIIREQWVRELHDKQLDQVVAHYAPDAAFLSPSGGRFTGPAAIRGLFKNVMDAVTSNLALHSIVTESSGDLAYDSGDYAETLVPMKGGPDQHFQGDYLMVFKRQRDGKWLIVQHVWTFAGTDIIPKAN